MSTLSQFFGGISGSSSITCGSVFRIFGTTDSMTIPATACEVAYGVIGGGGSAMYGCFCSSSQQMGGGGGGFSYRDGLLTCGSSYTICAVVGAGGSAVAGSPCGGTSCISGFSLGTICATGGQSTCGMTCSTPCNTHCGGCGIGGTINTCGGSSIWFCTQPTSPYRSAGGGAGGLFGNGGLGLPSAYDAGGGGYGSGGGGGGATNGGSGLICGRCYTGVSGAGGALGSDASQSTAAFGGDGLAGRGGSYAYFTCMNGRYVPAESGYIPSYTNNAKYSQAKTFLAAAGGGGHGAVTAAVIGYSAGNGAAGGGGGATCGSGMAAGNGGFGGGGGTNAGGERGGNGGIGGGGGGKCGNGAACFFFTGAGAGGQGIAIVEYWVTP